MGDMRIFMCTVIRVVKCTVYILTALTTFSFLIIYHFYRIYMKINEADFQIIYQVIRRFDKELPNC